MSDVPSHKNPNSPPRILLGPSNSSAHTRQPPVQQASASVGSIVEKTATLRRSPSLREFRHLIIHRIPQKLFKRPNQSETCLPVSISAPVPDDNNKSLDTNSGPTPTVTASSPPAATASASPPTTSPPKDRGRQPSVQMDWAPDLTPVSFKPELTVEIGPISPPTSLPHRPSRNFTNFRRKLSFRSAPSSPQTPTAPSRQPSLSKYSVSGHSSNRTHERRRSKYLNDPVVLSMLDRKFEDALELGFSPPATPQNRSPSPHYETGKSPITPSMDGTTIIEEEEDEDFFSRPTPNLTLPTLKELEDGELKEGTGEVMTLRLTLTPATCLTEVEREFPLEPTVKRMSGLGRILGRTRSMKVRI